MHSGYVLHRRRYRETSLIVEFLTPDAGRIAAVARGAMRRKSDVAAVLQPLVPLRFEVRGRSELLTLIRAEAAAPALDISGMRLYSVFYMNELVMRMTASHDPAPALFGIYCESLAALASDSPVEPLLRRFETALLGAVGVGLHLDSEAESGLPIDAKGDYVYVLDHGPVRAGSGQPGWRVRGATLLALAGTIPFDDMQLAEAKHLMRQVLNHRLEGRPLASRELFTTPRTRRP